MRRFCGLVAAWVGRDDDPAAVTVRPGAAEWRASVRQPCHATTYCQLAPGRPDDLCWPAQVRDISVDGVGLVLARGFQQGTVLEFELHNDRRGRWAQALVRVVRSAARDEGGWLVGCVFARKLAPEELNALL